MTISDFVDWEQHLSGRDSPTFHFVPPDSLLTPSRLLSVANKLAFCPCVVDGARLDSKDAALRELATAMRFPSYFGWNWDAVDDLLTDLSWIGERGILLVVTDVDVFRRRAFDEFVTFIQVVSSALGRWADVPHEARALTSVKPFHVVFSGTADAENDVVRESTQTVCIHRQV